MKRGSRFFVAFTDGETDKKGDSSKRRGRSAELLKLRNEKVLHRYYYHSRILNYKYEMVLTALRLEFDLSESTLIQLVEDNAGRLREISNSKFSRLDLKKMYPHFSWNDKGVELNGAVKQKEVYVLK